MTSPRRHLSMLRSYTPADALTIGNATCGTISIFLCLDYIAAGNRRFLWIAFILLPLALVCDVLDGYVARLNPRRQSVLGADLDSLSDVISFGVAPAVLGFTLGLRGGWDMLLPHLLRRLRRQPSGAVQRHRRGAGRHDHREGEVLRRHADPDQHRHRRCCSAWRSASGRIDDRLVVGRCADRPGAAASAGADLCRERQRDDQRDVADTEAVTPSFGRLPPAKRS